MSVATSFAELQAGWPISSLIIFSWVSSQALIKSSSDAATVSLYEFVYKSFHIKKKKKDEQKKQQTQLSLKTCFQGNKQ